MFLTSQSTQKNTVRPTRYRPPSHSVSTQCGVLQYAVTPSTAKSLYPISVPNNTWNGPIVQDENGTFHLFDPIYAVGSLGGSLGILHGVANQIEGPYNFDKYPRIAGGHNPGFTTFVEDGKTMYSLWPDAGGILVADSLDGTWSSVGAVPAGNPAPIFLNGSFYVTSQHTDEVLTAKSLSGPWLPYSKITVPWTTRGRREDPFMWIDRRGNWHIVNHAYDTSQLDHCGNSTLSAHQFSEDGITWHMVEPNVEPYSHTVNFDDGTSHTYTTLERPFLFFNENRELTHISLAADLVTEDAGCNSISNGEVACTNCKYRDHCGTFTLLGRTGI